MLRLVARRLLQGVLTVFVAATVSFFLLHLAPGDPFGDLPPNVPAQVRQDLIRKYALDRPVAEQYARYIAGVARGDLDWSFSNSRPVADVLADALPHTAILAAAGLLLSMTLGVVLGVVQAVAHRRAGGRALGAVSLFFYSVPEFWLGLALLVVFAYWLGLFPLGGAYDTVSYEYFTPAERLLNRLAHLTLPALTIALGTAAAIVIYHVMRSLARWRGTSQEPASPASVPGGDELDRTRPTGH